MRVKIVNTPNQYGEGGNMNTDIPDAGQHGGYFSNDVRYINSGGTHEENPNQEYSKEFPRTVNLIQLNRER